MTAEPSTSSMEITTNSDSEKVIKMNKKRRRIQDEDNEKYTHPTTSKKAAKPPTNDSIEAARNIYNNLPIEDMPTPNPAQDADKEAPTERRSNKKPPPIYLYGRFTEQKRIDQEMKKLAPSGFQYKYIGKDATLVFTNNYDEYKKVVEYYKKGKAGFHTYTAQQEKTHAFVLKGLCQTKTIEELKEELILQKINVKNIFKMKGTPEHSPAYLIVTDALTKITDLQRKVKVIDFTIIRWERHYNSKVITQCHRCQRWGHATSNCFTEPACLKCGDDHLTRECTKPLNTPPKCANCREAHLSNSTTCRFYIKALERTKYNSNRQENQQQKTYIPAPPPRENFWENRKSNTTINNNQDTSPTEPNRSTDTQHARGINKVSADSQNNFEQLTYEVNKLNTLINIDKMLNLIRILNNKLVECKDNMSRFITFNTFVQELNSVNLV